MRIAFTDGEMSNLSADFGQHLCACVVEYRPVTPAQVAKGARPWTNLQTITLEDYEGKRWDDRTLAASWRDLLEEYDVIVTWNGLKFDLPFLETRLRRWGLRDPKLPRHKDLLYTARFKLRLSSNRLDNVSDYLQVERKYGIAKTAMDGQRWTMAMGGHRPSYNYIIQHCKNDVKVLAAVWQEIKHLVSEIK